MKRFLPAPILEWSTTTGGRVRPRQSSDAMTVPCAPAAIITTVAAFAPLSSSARAAMYVQLRQRPARQLLGLHGVHPQDDQAGRQPFIRVLVEAPVTSVITRS